MKQNKYISITVRLACLSHGRRKPLLNGVDELLRKACSVRIPEAIA